MTTKIDNQVRADFESWAEKRGVWPRLTHEEIFSAGYQAARASLQSQDREDAERYRAWRKAASEGRGEATEAFMDYLFKQTRGIRLPEEDELDAAIDHARRIEGDGE